MLSLEASVENTPQDHLSQVTRDLKCVFTNSISH
jgi:hypothetical protein